MTTPQNIKNMIAKGDDFQKEKVSGFDWKGEDLRQKRSISIQNLGLSKLNVNSMVPGTPITPNTGATTASKCSFMGDEQSQTLKKELQVVKSNHTKDKALWMQKIEQAENEAKDLRVQLDRMK